MHLNGKLRPKPTSRLFLQDAVSGGRALMERPAALRATIARLEADHAAAPPLDLQAEAALVLARCAESAAARAQLLGHVPQLTRRLFKRMARLDDPAAPPVSMEVEGWVAGFLPAGRSRNVGPEGPLAVRVGVNISVHNFGFAQCVAYRAPVFHVVEDDVFQYELAVRVVF